jgi:hypothetical protein
VVRAPRIVIPNPISMAIHGGCAPQTRLLMHASGIRTVLPIMAATAAPLPTPRAADPAGAGVTWVRVWMRVARRSAFQPSTPASGAANG